MWKKEKISRSKDPVNYVNRKPNENEQKPISEKNFLKRKMLEEKLEENTQAMKKIRKSKSVDSSK